MRTLSAVGCLTAFIATLGLENATAQVDKGLSDQELIDPWQRAKAVVISLAPLLKATAAKEQRGRLDAELSKLDEQLSELQTELEKVAIRIVTVPEFAYEASNKSSELSAQVLEIEKSFDALFAELNIRERSDVQAMQSSMSSLRQTLDKQERFERDMVRAIASGSKNEMQALAGQWWRVGESVEGVKVAVRDLRAQPATATSSETKE
jgi:chromosome segregation ATPase